MALREHPFEQSTPDERITERFSAVCVSSAAGDRTVMVTAGGLPDLDACEFLHFEYRQAALRTQLNNAHHLILIRNWEQENAISLKVLAQKGECLSLSMAQSLLSFLRRRRKLAGPIGTLKRRLSNPQLVHKQEQEARIALLCKYLSFQANQVILRLASNDTRALVIAEKYQRLQAQLINSIPSAEAPRLPKPHLNESALDQLLEVISVDSSRNPFDPTLQRRNWVLVSLSFALGLRLGEILNLKLEDISFGAISTVTIIKRPLDKSEVRKDPPRPKKSYRQMPLHAGKLAGELKKYIDHDRAELASRSESAGTFVFLTQSGIPMGRRMLQTIFEVMRNEFPSILDASFSHHCCRHTFSTLIDRKLTERGFSSDERRRALMSLRGDSNEESQNVYISNEIKRRADAGLLAFQAEFLHDHQTKSG